MAIETQDARKQTKNSTATKGERSRADPNHPTDAPKWRQQKPLLNAQFPRKALVYEGYSAAFWQKANEFGWTIAHYAAGKGHVRLLQALSKWGVNLWIPGTGGRTAAHWAATNGHRNCLAYLLDMPHADVNASNNSGWALVHCAACQNQLECMQLLLERGANAEQTNNKGETARGATRSNKVRKILDNFIEGAAQPSTGAPGAPQKLWDAGMCRGRQGTFRFNIAAREFQPTTKADTERKAVTKAAGRPASIPEASWGDVVDTPSTSQESSPPTKAAAPSAADLIAIRAKRREERATRKALRQQKIR